MTKPYALGHHAGWSVQEWYETGNTDDTSSLNKRDVQDVVYLGACDSAGGDCISLQTNQARFRIKSAMSPQHELHYDVG